jgi:6-phosphogluconolactonase (cycloisomerase 2 family)
VEGTPYFSDLGATWVWLQTDPLGNYLFAAGQDYGAVLAIDNVTGGLTEIAFTDSGTWNIKSLVVAPTKPFLYSGNWGDNSIGAFTVDSEGVVDNVAHMPFAGGNAPKSLAITDDSKYLYVANYGYDLAAGLTQKAGEGTVWAYNVNRSSGALSRIGTYNLGLGAGPKHILTLP